MLKNLLPRRWEVILCAAFILLGAWTWKLHQRVADAPIAVASGEVSAEALSSAINANLAEALGHELPEIKALPGIVNDLTASTASIADQAESSAISVTGLSENLDDIQVQIGEMDDRIATVESDIELVSSLDNDEADDGKSSDMAERVDWIEATVRELADNSNLDTELPASGVTAWATAENLGAQEDQIAALQQAIRRMSEDVDYLTASRDVLRESLLEAWQALSVLCATESHGCASIIASRKKI